MTLFAVCLPGYIVMRVGAEWIYSSEHLDDLPDDPAWIGIGYITADAGALLLLISLILGRARHQARSRAAAARASCARASSSRCVLLAAYVVAIWAMGAKPT